MKVLLIVILAITSGYATAAYKELSPQEIKDCRIKYKQPPRFCSSFFDGKRSANYDYEACKCLPAWSQYRTIKK